ncbi:unnamed protein product [Brassica oleracea]|uniref:(rape) hypothetical protein n=2 Tax=Brassica napus TaxID=3708 RepID=A0A816IXK7_BRANA|nr:unnamed protein product [Brassica napus]
MGSLGRRSCGAFPPCLGDLQQCALEPVNLPLRVFLGLLSFPYQKGLRRVLRRGGVCKEMSSWSCQPRRFPSVAARAEIAGFRS